MPPGPKGDGGSDVDATDKKSRDTNVLKSGGEFKIILLKETRMCRHHLPLLESGKPAKTGAG